jgi:ABC-2 type transport system permease protein
VLRNITLKTLWDRRRAIFWWSVGLLATAIYTDYFYPTVQKVSAAYEQFLKNMPAALMASVGAAGGFDFTTPAGYLRTELYGMVVPLLFLIVTIGSGADAIAGEEERGTLDMLLANPVPRWRVVLEKFAALVIEIVIVALFFWLGLVIGGSLVKLALSPWLILAGTTSAVLLAIAIGGLTLAIGCGTGSKGQAMAIASGIAFAAYLLESMAPVVRALQPYRPLSPFYYYMAADPLEKGLDPGHAAVLLALAAVFVALGVLAFQRRDLAV